MKVFLIAGESSGDRLGAAVMAGLKTLVPEVGFRGIGGPAMTGQGLQSLFPMSDLSVMGLAEVLPRLPMLLRRRDEAVAAILVDPPDILLTIDSPDFCLRVARKVRAQSGIRTVHYVAPSVWAWRPGRAVKMARFIDHVLALLPFEPPLMEAAGMACDFVGHPVVADPQATPAEVAAFRAEVAADGPLVLALPGSRAGEVTRLADRFGAALALMAKDHPGLRVVLPAAAHVVDLVRDRTRDWPVRPLILDPAEDRGGARKRAAFAAADVALAASGTVSLELAAAGTPMVIAYDVSWLTRQIARRMVKLDTFTLVNLVSETRTIPEFIAENCQPGPIATALSAVLTESAPQHAAMARTMALLGKGGEAPGLRAARAILARV